MKKLVCLIGLICLFCSERTFSQVIKIENGVSFSKMNAASSLNIHNPLPFYTVNIGCDYLEKDWFFLSSEIGYVRKGGKGHSNDEIGFSEKNTLDCITLNTSFNVKCNVGGFNLYLGVAPTLDFALKNKYSSESLSWKDEWEMYPEHRVFLGIKPSIGMFYDINKIRLSLETFYMKNITKLSKFDGVKANTFLLSFGIGYKL